MSGGSLNKRVGVSTRRTVTMTKSADMNTAFTFVQSELEHLVWADC